MSPFHLTDAGISKDGRMLSDINQDDLGQETADPGL